MTYSKLAALRLSLKLIHQRNALAALAHGIRRHPQGEAILHKWATDWREKASRQTFPHTDAATSDLYAAISEEMAEHVLSELGL